MKEWGEDNERCGRAIYIEFWALMALSLLAFASAILFVVPAWAHSGGLAADGCHNDRKNGGRHCHRGANAGAETAPPRQTRSSDREVYYANCSAARAAGAAPVYRGDPGYASHLDRDNDGVGCE
jgi:hypothetical protein